MRFVTVIGDRRENVRGERQAALSRVAGVIFGSRPDAATGPSEAGILRSGLLGERSRPSLGSAFKPPGERRVFFALAGIVLGIFINLSSALAALDKDVNRDDVNASEYIHNVLPYAFLTHLLINTNDALTEGGVTDLTKEYTVIFDDHDGMTPQQENRESDELNREQGVNDADRVPVPEAVWSLDVSTGERSDYIIGLSDSETSVTFGIDQNYTHFATGVWPYPWINADTGGASWPTLLAPEQFQVASCDSSAERPDMDRCRSGDDYDKKYEAKPRALNAKTNNSSVDSSNSGSPLSSSSSSTDSQENQPGAIHDLSHLGAVDDAVDTELLDDLLNLNVIADLCDDIISCTTFSVSGPTGSTDPDVGMEPPIGPIDLLPLPDGPLSDPSPVFDPPPISIPPITSSTVPETSTWIMTMIGFGVIIAVGQRRRRLSSITESVTRTILGFIEQSFRRDTA